MIILTYRNKPSTPFPAVGIVPPMPQQTNTIVKFLATELEAARAAAELAARHGHTEILLSRAFSAYKVEPNVVVEAIE